MAKILQSKHPSSSAKKYEKLHQQLATTEEGFLRRKLLDLLKYLEERDRHVERGWTWPHKPGEKCECSR